MTKGEEDSEKDGGSCCVMAQKSYPKQVFAILGNEFCERFSYYGMKTILYIYLTSKLKFSTSDAYLIYHIFTMLTYFTPFLGGMIADSWLGKFWTIIWLSLLYAIGNVVMATTAIEGIVAGCFAGLALISIGTGGIKPCVPSLGADQFGPDQLKEQASFFGFFYFAINLGSLLSTYLTPLLRTVSCFGDDTCYFLAFGVPACLMIVSLGVFLIGSPWYIKTPVTDNVVWKVIKATWTGISRRCCGGKSKKEVDHWIYLAEPDFDRGFLTECKSVYSVLYMFLPIPFFWSVFDLQGSRFVEQATQMDGYIGFIGLRILPDQMQIINPLLIVILVPLFEMLVYPCMNHLKIPNRPLQRMSTGGFIAVAAFVLSAGLQFALDTSNHYDMPHLTLINSGAQPATIQFLGAESFNRTLQPYEVSVIAGDPLEENGKYSLITPTSYSEHTFYDDTYYYFSLGGQMLAVFEGGNDVEKLSKDSAFVQFLDYSGSDSVLHITKKGSDYAALILNANNLNDTADLTFLQPALYKLEIYTGDFVEMLQTSSGAEFWNINFRGIYTILKNGNSQSVVLKDREPYEISVLWQLPQIFLITLAEILVSVTGLNFAYTESPESMKAFLQASWLMTVAFGNVIIIVVTLITLPTEWAEYLLFAGMLFLVMIVFTVMAYFYTYVADLPKEDEDEKAAVTSSESAIAGKKNAAFEEDEDTSF